MTWTTLPPAEEDLLYLLLAVAAQHSNSSSSCGGLQLRRVHSRITVEWYIPSLMSFFFREHALHVYH
jgi:hypothetical protein